VMRGSHGINLVSPLPFREGRGGAR
jgi:hypothetical protein